MLLVKILLINAKLLTKTDTPQFVQSFFSVIKTFDKPPLIITEKKTVLSKSRI